MLELHRKILGDRLRNQAFYDALKKVIKPDESIVCDIGSGTGFLSFIALRLGAKESYLFEQGPTLELSKELAALNQIDRCHFIAAHSSAYKEKIQADILLSETLGNYALEENIIESIEDGKRFLKKGGIIIPGKITQFIAPVWDERLYKDVNIWDDIGFDLNFEPAKRVSLNNMYVKTIIPADIGGDESSVKKWDTIDFRKKNASKRSAKLTWNDLPDKKLNGFALWWNAELIPGISISTSPFDPPTHWGQIYLPLYNPISFVKGDTLTLMLESDTSPDVKVNLLWDVTVWSKDKTPKAHQHLDMQNGWL